MSLRPDLTQSDYELLSAYIDNMLADDERVLLDERLNLEPGLRDELIALQQTVKLIAQLPSLRAPRNFVLTPDVVSERPLLTVVPRPSLRQRRRIPVSLVSVMSAAASLLLVAMGMILLFSGDNGDTSSSVAGAPDTEVGLFSNISPSDGVSTTVSVITSNPMPTVSIMPAEPTDEGGQGQIQPELQDQEEQSPMAIDMDAQMRDDASEANAVGALAGGDEDMAGGGEAPLFAGAPAPAADGEQEALAAIQLDSNDTAFEAIALPTPSLFAAEPPSAPMTTVEGYSDSESRAVEDGERSTEVRQIPPTPTDLTLESATPLAAMQSAMGQSAATEVAEAVEESGIDEIAGADDAVMPGLSAQPVSQTESSQSIQDYTLLGVLLIVAGCVMFATLSIIVWLQRRRT